MKIKRMKKYLKSELLVELPIYNEIENEFGKLKNNKARPIVEDLY